MCVLSIASYGQIEKGNYLLGGNLGIIYSSNQDYIHYGMDIKPNVGYFVTDRLALGLALPFSFSRSKNDAWQYSYTYYGLSPFLRYYFAKRDKSAFFASTSFGFSNASSKNKSGSSDETKNSSTYTSANLSLGYVYFLTKNIGLEAVLGYNRNKEKDYDTRSDIRFNIGFQIYLGKGAKDSKK